MRYLKNKFDFFHIRQGLKFLQNPDQKISTKLANCSATEHLFRYHSSITGIKLNNRLEFTNAFLRTIDSETEESAQNNLKYIKKNILSGNQIWQMLKTYLPADYKFTGKIYVTCGLDSSTSFKNNISINPGHEKFRENPIAIKIDLMRELFHCAHFKYHKIPDNKNIKTGTEILDFIKFHTQSEGMAQFLASHLTGYPAVRFNETEESSVNRLFSVFESLKNYGNKAIDDWIAFHIMSSISEVWQKAGTIMAMRIFEHKGNQTITNLVKAGPEAFISEFISASNKNNRTIFTN